MPRQRMAPGEWGEIKPKKPRKGQEGLHIAHCYVRDLDGRRR
ncbi:hypothetical protein [Nocardia cyriacigeorgica]|nr:hypothetical protein [Nocardia cyriacigeorgica]